MKYILLNICVLISVVTLRAEGLTFSQMSWDFGSIKEEGGVVSHSFEVKNSGGSPVVINNVRTTCGCTTSEYSKRPIVAGGKMTLKISYDPLYRPGIFHKDVYVYSSASTTPYILKIEGDVTPRKLSMEEKYPYTLGDEGRIGSLYLSFRAIQKGVLTQQSVEYIYIGTEGGEIDFRCRDSYSRLQLYFDREAAEGEHKRVELGYYIDSRSPERGQLRDTVDIYVNGVKSNKSLYVKGLIVEPKE